MKNIPWFGELSPYDPHKPQGSWGQSERTPNFTTLHEGQKIVRYLIYPIDPFYAYAVTAQAGLCLALGRFSHNRAHIY